MLMALATFFHFSMSLHAAAPIDRCSALVGTCEYYSCVEEERISCGPRGYPLGYGVNYCEKLSALEFTPARTALNRKVFPADGNAWRDSVRTCLQQEMEEFFKTESNVSCENLRDFAFSTHPSCYTQTISFCDLTPESVVKVGLTIGPEDLFSDESFRQVQDTAQICSDHLAAKIKVEPSFLTRLQMHKYRAVWDSIRARPEMVHEEMEALESDPTEF